MRLRLSALVPTTRSFGLAFLAALTFAALPACSSADASGDESAIDGDAGADEADIAGAIEGDPENTFDGGEDLEDEDQTATYDALPDWDEATDGDSGASGGETLTDSLTIGTESGSLVQNGTSLLKPCKKADGYSRGKHFIVCVTVLEGKLVSISTATNYLRMKAARSSLKIVSGFRTYQEQVNLYNKYRNGTGNLAAKPGYSNHESGLALDLNTSASGNYAWMVANGGRYGFRRTVPSEKWHWED